VSAVRHNARKLLDAVEFCTGRAIRTAADLTVRSHPVSVFPPRIARHLHGKESNVDQGCMNSDESRELDEAVVLVDCGQASIATRGLPLLAAFELGWPPNNRMYVG